MQTQIDKYFYYLFIVTLTFGVMLYNVIKFDYTDEICALLLFILFLVFMIKTKDWEMNKAFLITLFVFLFYLCYSIYIQSNTKAGIFNDLFVQIKPFLGFFCVYAMKPRMDENRKAILKSISVVFWFILLAIGIGDLFVHRLIYNVVSHPSHYGAMVVVASFCYFYCSKFTMIEKLKFLLMLSIGLLSGRSKFYGFYALAIFVVIFFSQMKVIKLNFKNIMILAAMFAAIILVAWKKIDFYFYQVLTGDMDMDLIARFVLYATAPAILIDYFPFGSGLASFATYSSGQFYSPLYNQYGIDGVWGISRSYYSFIADTYYPSLAQFGVAGVILYAIFWFYILKKAYTSYMKGDKGCSYLFYIVILIVSYLAIDGIADATFISYRGFFVMMMLGLILVEIRDKENSVGRLNEIT